MRLSQVGVQPMDLDAVFITHIHSDHVEGFSDIAQMRWFFSSQGPKLDVVCSDDAATPPSAPTQFVLSCEKFVRHINDAYHEGGTNAQQATELEGLDPAGPVPLLNIVTFEPAEDPEVVWSKGDVTVSAIGSYHIPGHASYRVDTPAGSVVIGGDASNDTPEPPRSSSASEQVEELARGADIVVHSAAHPDLDPAKGSGLPPIVYYRQSNATDLGAMAQRAGARYLMLTHLGPAHGATTQGPFPLPGGVMTEARYRDAALSGGFTGEIVLG
jgi:ribonuclease Z